MSASENGKRKRTRNRTREKKSPDYEVGYKKPPRSGQIQLGERRNPKGRPKGSRNFNSIMRQLMEKSMTLLIDGEKVSVSGREAIAYRVFQKAVAGDAKCIEILRSIDESFDTELAQRERKISESRKLSKTDEAILADFLKTSQRKKKK